MEASRALHGPLELQGRTAHPGGRSLDRRGLLRPVSRSAVIFSKGSMSTAFSTPIGPLKGAAHSKLQESQLLKSGLFLHTPSSN